MLCSLHSLPGSVTRHTGQAFSVCLSCYTVFAALYSASVLAGERDSKYIWQSKPSVGNSSVLQLISSLVLLYQHTVSNRIWRCFTRHQSYMASDNADTTQGSKYYNWIECPRASQLLVHWHVYANRMWKIPWASQKKGQWPCCSTPTQPNTNS